MTESHVSSHERVRHVDINLPRFANRGVVSSARTSGRRSAKEGVLDAPYRGWKGGLPKTFSDALRAYKSPSPGRANSLVHLPYPKAQCGTCEFHTVFVYVLGDRVCVET